MKLKFLIKKVLPVMLVAAMMLATSANSFAAVDMAEYLTDEHGYEMHSEKLNVQKSKEFNIIFSKNVDSATSTGVRIVEKEGSAPVDVKTSVEGLKHIKVNPIEEFKLGSSYYLIIDSPEMDSNAVGSSNGEKLEKGIVCEFMVQGEHIYDASAVGSSAVTYVSGTTTGADRVIVEYGDKAKTANLENGAFSWSIFPAVQEGTTVTIKAYSGSTILEQLSIESEQ